MIRGRFRLPLPGGASAEVLGGPFDALPPGVFSVCLEAAAEKAWLADILLPTPDFGVPEPEALRAAVARALAALAAEPSRPLFVGCRAGLGRTGLFLGCLLVAAGVAGDPVAQLRRLYHPAAAETPEQEAAIRSFRP
ncbi:MAG: tyrosine-protein phosphatase [Acetobacteraceae bacterium]|nr:tyrosine-protein phosphatase [Acetobacteraceae bacterium]MCX7684155.1 tyrosine-protein phosphatase [Acetobacteraceae bacterium]MDW8399218.1 tyrosine-protein phosphatase [Acetobacteraceae bacterium]